MVPGQLHAHLHRRPAARTRRAARGAQLPLAAGWERVISGNSCPKGLVEDVNELREVKTKLEEVKREYPNVAEMVRDGRVPPRPELESERRRGLSLRIGIPRVLNLWSTASVLGGLLRRRSASTARRLVFSSDTSEEQGRQFGKGRGTVDCCYPVKCIAGHYGELDLRADARSSTSSSRR